jgi:selenocysteine lyase/cysteine desulfurase
LEGDQLQNIEMVKKATNERIAAHEARLMAPLLEFLESQKTKGVKIMGLEVPDPAKRAPTVSFIVRGKSSRVIAESFDEKQVRFFLDSG